MNAALDLEDGSCLECRVLEQSLERAAIHHADTLKLAKREIERLRGALNRIHVIASSSPSGIYAGHGPYSRELDMAFDLGRIEVIAQRQRDVPVQL